jgi:tRNA (Thr-GGU) A37 N-methylase
MGQPLVFVAGALFGLFLSWRFASSPRQEIMHQMQVKEEKDVSTSVSTKVLHEHCQKKIAAERSGRIKAERMIREHVVDKLVLSGYPLVIIGNVKSPYKARRGTPRQGLLVSNSRSKVVLSSDMPIETLSGLEGYSHMYIIFLFHENTNLLKSLSGCNASSSKDSTLKNRTANGKSGKFSSKVPSFAAKVLPPLLNGGSIGLFATRSPHRPNAIGMSLVKIVDVCQESRTVVVAGADLVDGTPIIDLKPYGPFDCPNCLHEKVHPQDDLNIMSPAHGTNTNTNQCDSFKSFIPEWVDHGINNPYKLKIEWTDGAMESIKSLIENNKAEFYGKNEAQIAIDAISQMLGLDIRYVIVYSCNKIEASIKATGRDPRLKEIKLFLLN